MKVIGTLEIEGKIKEAVLLPTDVPEMPETSDLSHPPGPLVARLSKEGTS